MAPNDKKRRRVSQPLGLRRNGCIGLAVLGEDNQRTVVTMRKRAACILSEYVGRAANFQGASAAREVCDLSGPNARHRMRSWELEVLNKYDYLRRQPRRIAPSPVLAKKTWQEACELVEKVLFFSPPVEVTRMLLMSIHKSLPGEPITVKAVIDWSKPLLSDCILTPSGGDFKHQQSRFFVNRAITKEKLFHPLILEVVQQKPNKRQRLVGLLIKTALSPDAHVEFVPAEALEGDDEDARLLRSYLDGSAPEFWHHISAQKLEGQVARAIYEFAEHGLPEEVVKEYVDLVMERKEMPFRQTLEKKHAPVAAQQLYGAAWEEMGQQNGEAGKVTVGLAQWDSLQWDIRTAMNRLVKKRDWKVVSGVEVKRSNVEKNSSCWLCFRSLGNAKAILGSTCQQRLSNLINALEDASEDDRSELTKAMYVNPDAFKAKLYAMGHGQGLEDLKLKAGALEDEYEVRKLCQL